MLKYSVTYFNRSDENYIEHKLFLVQLEFIYYFMCNLQKLIILMICHEMTAHFYGPQASLATYYQSSSFPIETIESVIIKQDQFYY